MSIAFVQGKTNHATGVPPGPTTVTFDNAVSVGSLIFFAACFAESGGDQTLTGISGFSATWTKIGSTQRDGTNSQCCEIWMGENATGGGSTLTVTPLHGGASWGANTMAAVEFSGVATASSLDTSNTAKAFASTSAGTVDAETSNAITTANWGSRTALFTVGTGSHNYTVQVAAFKAVSGTDQVVVGAFQDTGGAQASVVHGTGYTDGVVDLGVGGFTGATAVDYLILSSGVAPGFLPQFARIRFT